MVCLNPFFWADYWRKKAREEEAINGITAKERRKIRKESLKGKSHNEKKAIKRLATLAAHNDVYGMPELCTKNSSGTCDKKAACSILGECLVSIPRFKDKPELLESFRGPKTLKEIIRALKTFDPSPMKSYYLRSRDKIPQED